ncbi:MAG: choice-of-anchor B family protein [Acidobacteria bacterium]|nr:choice-of-anchor B family protein [Acidobacteriota bacterium]
MFRAFIICVFGCIAWGQNVTFRSQVPLNQFSLNPSSGNDIWGITDPAGRDYAIMGSRNGTAVFDISNPDVPVEVGTISGPSSTWRDVKTFIYNTSPFSAYAFVTTEASGGGLQIIDLSNLPTSISLAATYSGFSSAHNIYIDPNGTEPYAYILGANISSGGVVVLDISNPTSPVQVGAWSSLYTHDFYLGRNWADPTYDGQDIGIAFCGSSNFSIINFSDKTNPTLLDGYTYPNLNYCHSGWVSEDGRYLFACDELDEQNATLNTTIRVFDLIDLTSPQLIFTWTGPTRAIDHNAFVKGSFLYLSNYTRGLTVLDISNPGMTQEYGNYDTFPSNNNAVFSGAWGTYPYFDSGLVVVSDIEGGLFVLEPEIQAGFSLSLSGSSFSGCVDATTIENTINTTSILSFSGAISLSVSGMPTGVTALFSTNPVTPGNATTLSFELDAGVVPGDYPLTLHGTAVGADPKQASLMLSVFGGSESAPTGLSPAHESSCVGSQSVTIGFDELGPGRQYRLLLADNPSMTSPLLNALFDSSPIALPPLAVDQWYYWQLATANPCGEGSFSPIQSFFTSRPPVLLVDDDDNSPNVRPYYEGLLQGLGVPYNVFDVGNSSANGPSLSQMMDYQWIIWFSGDQYGGTSTPQAGPTDTDEANLIDYLNAGGYLFMTSQDYAYDQGGITPFMTNQLGIGSVGSDSGDYSSVTGEGSFVGYGTLSLTPTVGSEFFDRVTPGTGTSIFVGNNGNGAGVETSNTITLGFPFETVIQNDNPKAISIVMDLMNLYGVGCDTLSAQCMLYDLNANGLDLGDLQARYVDWPDSGMMQTLTDIVTCLNLP